jgi:RNA polymerase sigma-70 factor, ECF subfamily
MAVRDEAAAIYEQERQFVYQYLLSLGVEAGRAQELAQDCFVQLYRRMLAGESIQHPRAWLFKVAQNAARRHYRREASFCELLETPASNENPERGLLEKQADERLRSIIATLSEQQQHCLHLRVRGLRYREIAEQLGISTSAVGEYLRRAVERLKAAAVR